MHLCKYTILMETVILYFTSLYQMLQYNFLWMNFIAPNIFIWKQFGVNKCLDSVSYLESNEISTHLVIPMTLTGLLVCSYALQTMTDRHEHAQYTCLRQLSVSIHSLVTFRFMVWRACWNITIMWCNLVFWPKYRDRLAQKRGIEGICKLFRWRIEK